MPAHGRGLAARTQGRGCSLGCAFAHMGRAGRRYEVLGAAGGHSEAAGRAPCFSRATAILLWLRESGLKSD